VYVVLEIVSMKANHHRSFSASVCVRFRFGIRTRRLSAVAGDVERAVGLVGANEIVDFRQQMAILGAASALA
jgi:hypothetical protein